MNMVDRFYLIPDFCWQTAKEIMMMWDAAEIYLDATHVSVNIHQWAKTGKLDTKIITVEYAGGVNKKIRLYKRKGR